MSEKNKKIEKRESRSFKIEKRESGSFKKSRKDAAPGALIGRKIVYEKDAYYKFKEPKLIKAEETLNYFPVYFLRTHSKNNDSSDVQTQIWQCAFEPDPHDITKHTDIVATCGGTSVCFINVKSGEVVLKYSKSTKSSSTEYLYALAWSTLPLDDVGLKSMNILAAGGGKSSVVLIHPEAGCLYQMFRTVPNKQSATVNALLFHPKKSSWLFCGHEDGHIQLWDIGIPSLPSYDVSPINLLLIPAAGGDNYNLAFSQTSDLLIAGCNEGLFAWNIDFEKVEKGHRLERTQINIPNGKEVGTVVDSLCLIRDDILAFKCALHGFIYIFKLSEQLKKASLVSDSEKELNLTDNCILKLKWSDTDNYYMNMGIDSSSCTLVCGDDKGKLWIYDIFHYIKGDIKSPLTGGNKAVSIDSNLQLEWPELEDHEVEKARKLRLDTYDIVVDKCTVSDGGKYIVAVTSNNMVCIWKRGKEEDNEDGSRSSRKRTKSESDSD